MKKVLSILLLIAMLIVSLVSCGGNGNGGTETTTKPSGGTGGSGDAETTPYLEAQDLDGFEYVLLLPPNGQTLSYNPDEIDDNSIMERAKFQRDSEIKDRFNVVLKDLNSPQDAMVSFILTDAFNTESSYSAARPYGWEDVTPIISSQAAYNVLDMPYIDPEQPWYDSSAVEAYSFLGKMYFLPGMFPGLSTGDPLLFNKNMIDDIEGLEYPYQLIFDGEWTIDKMLEYTSAGYKDIDETPGPSRDDQFGYASYKGGAYVFYAGFGEMSATQDENGALIPVLSGGLMDTYFDKLYAFETNPDHYFADNSEWIEGKSVPALMFSEGRAMFTYWGTATVDYTDIDAFEYGLAINPKYDLDQDRYYTIGAQVGVSFPVNLGDPDSTGLVHEALCEASYRITYPADIQESVEFERLTDEESIKVQEICVESLVCDPTYRCDPSGGVNRLGVYFQSCLKEGTAPSIKVQEVGDVIRNAYNNFFYPQG